jgi:hypothetical protein
MSRRYGGQQKLDAVALAEASSPTRAAAATGIPRRTIADWVADPAFADLRAVTRAELGQVAKAVAAAAWSKLFVAVREGRLGPRDLIVAAGVASEKYVLLGEAAEHTTTPSPFEDLTIEERRQFQDAIRRVREEAAFSVADRGEKGV